MTSGQLSASGRRADGEVRVHRESPAGLDAPSRPAPRLGAAVDTGGLFTHHSTHGITGRTGTIERVAWRDENHGDVTP